MSNVNKREVGILKAIINSIHKEMVSNALLKREAKNKALQDRIDLLKKVIDTRNNGCYCCARKGDDLFCTVCSRREREDCFRQRSLKIT